MDRRAFLGGLAGAVLAAAPVAGAQQPKKPHRIAMIERTSAVINAANVDGFRHGLRELGYIEGESFVIEYRSADGRDERFPDLATEVVRLKVDLILTRGTPAALAARNATGWKDGCGTGRWRSAYSCNWPMKATRRTTSPLCGPRAGLELGGLEITGISPTSAADERRLIFDPSNRTDGIDLSSDPILLARSAAYGAARESDSPRLPRPAARLMVGERPRGPEPVFGSRSRFRQQSHIVPVEVCHLQSRRD